MEKKYWREGLKSVVTTIKFISSYSLAFRGKNEVFFSESNGNYIGALEYLSSIHFCGNTGKNMQTAALVL